MFYAHIGGMDTLARGLMVAEKMLEDRKLIKQLDERYAGWEQELGKKILSGKMSLDDLGSHVLKNKLEPKPRSGRQEFLENLVARYL
jgi:xylose isomerase